MAAAGDILVRTLALLEGKADAVLAASRFHFEELTISQVKEYLHSKRIVVRR